MQTNFSSAQLRDPKIAEANQILRKCVHCGFCTATCPTYVLLGDELDSPRGPLALNKGHNPIHNIYLRKVEGKENKVVAIAVKDLTDPPRGCKL